MMMGVTLAEVYHGQMWCVLSSMTPLPNSQHTVFQEIHGSAQFPNHDM